MPKYRCSKCGKIGTKGELRIHCCVNGAVYHRDDDPDFLSTLILAEIIVGAVSEESSPVDTGINEGGGTFGGGGASSDWGGSSDSCSFDSGGGDSGSCGSD